MPLHRGRSAAIVGDNIREMLAAGHPRAQAVAAAEREKDMFADADIQSAYHLGRAHEAARSMFDEDPREVDLRGGSYGDFPGQSGVDPKGGFYTGYQGNNNGPGGQSAGSQASGASGASGASTSNPDQGVWSSGSAPAYVPGASAYQYGGTPGGAAAAQAGYAQAGQNAQAQKAAQVSNAYGLADRAQNQGVLSGEQGLQSAQGNLAAYYQGQLNGTGPNLAAQQARASTDQSIQAQEAVANSARGPLAAAGASRAAAAGAAQAQQAGAQQAVQGTVAQENQAQAGLQGLYGQQANLYGTMGQQSLTQSGQDLSNAQYAAGLQQQQNALGQETALGYAGLGANVAQSQLSASEQQQQANLQAAGLGQQQSQFQTQQNNQIIGTGLAAGGALIGAFADADFKEPGGGAAFTLREEDGGPNHAPFLAMIDRTTGRVGKVPMAPLTAAEHAQLYKPHGAGPLDSPQRAHTTVHDMFADADLTDAGTSKVSRPRATFQADHDADELYAPVPGDVSGMTVRDRHGVAPQRKASRTVDLRHGMYGDFPGKPYVDPLAPSPGTVDTSADADPLNAGYANFNGVNTHPRTLEDQRADRVRAAHDAQQAAIHDDWRAPLGDRIAAADVLGLDPSSRASVSEEGGVLNLHPRSAAPPGPPGPIDPSKIVVQGAPADAGGPVRQAPPVLPAAGAGGGGRPGFALGVRPQDAEAIRQGGAEQLAGVTDARDAELHQTEDQGVAALQKGDILGRHDTENADLQAARKLDEDRVMTLRANASQDAAKLGEHYGFHPSAARSIGMAIAQGLGAAGAALTHGENSAAKIVSAKIDRELDTQKQQIESAKGRVSDLDTALAQTYRQTGNMREALALSHITQLQKADQDAAGMAAASNSEAVKAKYEIMHGQFQERIAQENAKLYRPTVTGGGGGVTREKVLKRAMELRDKHPDLTSEDAQRQALADLGVGPAQGALPVHEKDAGAKDKPNPDAAALEALANDPTLHGQDFYDRNAPDFLRSSASLRNEVGLRALGNETSKAEGARAAPVTVPTGDVIRSTIGRGTDEDVEAAKLRARRIAEAKKHAATARDDQ